MPQGCSAASGSERALRRFYVGGMGYAVQHLPCPILPRACRARELRSEPRAEEA